MQKQLLSFGVLIVFVLLAWGSAVNKIHYGAFNYNNKVEDKVEKRNYLVKNDGTKIYGEKISWKSGLLAKDQIQVDDQKFRITEIRGYRQGETYFDRLGNEYIKRIVRGKVNVYVKFTEVASTTTDRNGFTRTRYHTRTDQYAQRGEDGPMKAFGGQDDIKEIVSDCPLSVQMIDMSNSKIRKAIKKDPNYLNSVFETYNNDCKPVH
jgi:hypothetical protein